MSVRIDSAVRAVARQQQGSVLLCALMVIALIATVGAALALVVTTESALAGTYQTSQQTQYAADAGIERAIDELRLLPTWAAVASSTYVSPSADFNDGQIVPTAPDGTSLNLAQLTTRRQAESDAVYPISPDRPLWHLYGHASLRDIGSTTQLGAPYVVVWLADDPDDLDGNPSVDTNDVVMVHAEAFGVRGGKRVIDATIQREQAMDAGSPGLFRTDVHVIASHEQR